MSTAKCLTDYDSTTLTETHLDSAHYVGQTTRDSHTMACSGPPQ